MSGLQDSLVIHISIYIEPLRGLFCIVILIHMANATIYIQKDNQETWDKIPSKSDFINKVLVQLGEEMKEAEAKNNGDQNETPAKDPKTKVL